MDCRRFCLQYPAFRRRSRLQRADSRFDLKEVPKVLTIGFRAPHKGETRLLWQQIGEGRIVAKTNRIRQMYPGPCMGLPFDLQATVVENNGVRGQLATQALHLWEERRPARIRR